MGLEKSQLTSQSTTRLRHRTQQSWPVIEALCKHDFANLGVAMSERTGKCLCGAVTYRISADPIAARICWCHDCQRIASNGTVNILVQTESLKAQGETNAYVSIADSGNHITRRFCPKCGSHLFANSSARPQFTVVRAGTLDDPSSIKPSMNIWSQSAPVWACLDPDIERIEQQP